MRVVAGAWRGRTLTAPPGWNTRPTADRVRQALFDMLLHAPWGGRGVLEGAQVLDAFAGTGALGLEALSRGASHATFVEQDRAALAALRANIASCRAEARATVLARDLLTIGPPPARCGLVFLDPPYGQDLVRAALSCLRERGWVDQDTLILAEISRDEAAPALTLLADRTHGAARLVAWRAATDGGVARGDPAKPSKPCRR